MDKTISIASAAIFGALGLAALIGALFFGATHQFAVAIICAGMTWGAIAEYNDEKRKEEEDHVRNH